jgi:3-oxoacyl-[acyl-carrier protein] reductase
VDLTAIMIFLLTPLSDAAKEKSASQLQRQTRIGKKTEGSWYRLNGRNSYDHICNKDRFVRDQGEKNMGKLNGKIALVTGASKGIGAGIALSLAQEGAAVAVNYASDRAGAERVVEKIRTAGGNAIAIQGSVTSSVEINRFFDETERQLGAVDVLVNNAGVFAYLPLQDVNEAEFRRQFDTNVLGLLLTSKRAAQKFGEKGGSIINIGSVASTLTPPASSIYAATKSAVDGITRVLAKELGARNIRVNSINPGVIDTEGARAMDTYEQVATAIRAITPLGRTGMPEDIGLIAAFLASDEARWLTGEIIFGSGGLR